MIHKARVLKILSYVDRQLALREIETGTVSLHNVAVSTTEVFEIVIFQSILNVAIM